MQTTADATVLLYRPLFGFWLSGTEPTHRPMVASPDEPAGWFVDDLLLQAMASLAVDPAEGVFSAWLEAGSSAIAHATNDSLSAHFQAARVAIRSST